MIRPPKPPAALSAHERYRVLRDEEAGHGDEYRFIRALATAGREFGLAQGVARLAAEVACLQPDLDAGDRIALTVLAWSTLAAAQEGSVRVPLSGEGAGCLPTLVERLGAAMKPKVEDRPEDPVEAPEGFELPSDLLHRIRALLDGERASVVVGSEEDARSPLVHLGDHVYAERHLRMELRVVAHVRGRADSPAPAFGDADVKAAVADVLARPAMTSRGEPMIPNAEQRAAIEAAATRTLTLLSGGPGTGKTYTAASMLRVLSRLGIPAEDVALAAPTGKAAQRMREAIIQTLAGVSDKAPADLELERALPEPKTLHRLLGYSPSADRFRHHRNHPIPERVVLVDETSMADLRLAERLLAAVRPDARLVLIGDADQLPSVAAGAVFRDLVQALDGVQLVESHRMRADDPAGRAILEAAQALRAGRAPVLSPTHEVPGPEGIHRLPVEWFKAAGDGTNGPRLNKDALTDFLKRWHAGVVCSTDLEPVSRTPLGTDLAAPEVAEPLGAAFRHVGRARILCVTRRGPSGVHAVNRALHAHTREHLGMPGGAFLPGEPVLVTENDYELNLFNGDQGLVVWLGGRRNADLHAVFQRSDGRYEAFPLAAVKARLEHAYALTVHKAQGSEYRRIAVVLPPEDMPLLSRELVYTALTRASKAVLVVGAAERLADAAARSEERHCGVGERLSGGR